MEPNSVPDWLQIAAAYGTALGALGVIAAVATFWFQWVKSRDERNARTEQFDEDRRRYDAQMAALQRAENDRIAAQARKVVPTINRADRFGENLWLAHIDNSSTGVVSALRVVVKAYDRDNNEIPHAVRKAPGELDISGGIEKIIGDALGGALSGAVGPTRWVDSCSNSEWDSPPLRGDSLAKPG